MRSRNIIAALAFLFVAHICSLTIAAQETPPAPGTPRSVTVPPVQQEKLANGLTVAVVERKTVPLVTIQLLVKSGADSEPDDKAGLANLTADMLTKGTSTKSATQIAEAIEFLGGSINTGAGWNGSFLSLTVTSDKVEQAVAILSDLILNPKFDQKELDLLKTQALDELTYNLKQPSFIGGYAASKFSYAEHPAGGTPASIGAVTRADVAAFHHSNYLPNNSVLIFTGDISKADAAKIAGKAFSTWKPGSMAPKAVIKRAAGNGGRILVIDLPKAGQAAVTYARPLSGIGRASDSYFPAIVLNAVLGNGYSSRLNMEIRIKRGLSYGAGSAFSWRPANSNFSARTQTENRSAAEVAELVMAELQKLKDTDVSAAELVPRKSVLTGNFGRDLETTAGLAGAVSDLYSFNIPTSALNTYMANVNAVRDAQIKSFAAENLAGGDIIIVGDYSIFKDDLAKRFPNTKIEVINAADLDLSKLGLIK
jgi:zinc protease